MKELEKIFCVLAFVLLLCVGNLSAQYAKIVDSKKYSKSEMSLFSASIAYFESADYANAYMGFSQLHSWYASDPVFSYYCGASMVMLRNEYDKAIKYLSLAYDNNLYEADYYIGLAYHRKYLFSKSITYYSRYRDYLVKATKGRSPKIAEVEMLMEKANKARALGQESFALKVLTNSKVKRSNFHFSYGRKILDGNLVVKPDFFRQRNDKNNRDIDLVYVLDTIAFVSSYGNDMKTGLDLYVSRKTDEGWSPLQLLPGMVNTDYDEAFPFLSSDGVLYFASKGHNSIGGYDIFKSEYDAGLGLWGKPENLGFPINTPYDDFMYAIESNGKSAFFASDRSSKDGQVMVCRYVLEPDVEKIMIKTEEDLAEHAELPVTPGAEAEYERISREQPAEPEAKDSTPDKVEPQRELDTTDLFVSTRTMLDEKISAISNYDEYSQKLDAYARITSNKIRKAKISGSNSGMSSSEIAQMANSVVIFYDLSRKFNSVYATAKPTLERCAKDMESLGKMEPGSGEYQFRLHNINVSVGKVNAKSPLAVMIAEKKNERKQADDVLKKLSRNMEKDRKNLREINEKLESVMQLIQKETDPKLRERYVNEHKTLENSKVDVINEMKNMQVEAKRLNLMIQKTDESIKMLEDIDEIIANIDLNALEDEAEVGSGDILEMKDLVSEEEDKVVTEFEKAVDEDESLYSEVIDYESISSGAENDARLVTDEVLALEGYMSSSTSAVVQKMKATDALYSEKSNLESQFDTTETEPEKTELLNQINATQKQITENVKAIEAELSYRENPSVSKAIEDFNAIKQTKVEGEAWSDLVSTTQNLIEKSNELAEQMSGQKQPSAVSDVKAKLVGRIKADIDNQIVDNVAEMQDFAVSQQNKREVADMSREVTKIRSSAKDKSFEADIMKDISSVTKKVEASKRETSGTGSNLAEAENILDGTVVKRIAILNEEYDAESRVYDVLNEKYSATKSSDRLRQQADVIYYSALEDKQQADAETDDVVRMKYLSEANKKMKSANSALMQAISPDAKLETQSNDEITESILTLYNDIKAQKGVLSSLAEPLDPSRPLSNNNPPTEPVDPSRPLSNTNPPTEPVEVKDNETSIQNAQHNGVVEGSGRPISSQSLQHSVTLQTDLTKRISTNNDDITTIATNMATADRGEKKRLQTFLGEVTAERNDNVRTLGEEKQRFYAELDKAKHDDIAKTSASTDYTNRYADYRQSLYSLTNADLSAADMTEKLADAEKSEFALLQTIIPNVDTETSIVLVQIYSELDAKYGNTSPAEPVEASASSLAQNDPMSNSQSVIVSNNPSSNPPTEPVDPSRPLSVVEGSGRPISSQSLQHSVTLQTDLTKRISTNNDDITTIATNMATAGRGEKKRLQTELGEVISERDGNVRTLGEEKQHFYSELDKVINEEISKTTVSTEYANRYADYRQSLYTLTNADPSSADMTEKLAEAEKSEYALLQTIIPNVDTETSIVLVQIYSELDAKYGNTSPAEPVEASASSLAQNDPMSNSQSVIVSNNPSSNPPTVPVDPSRPLSVAEGSGNDISAQNSQQNGVAKELDDNSAITTSVDSQQLKASVVRQSEISNRITINASEISAIEGVIAASAGSDKQRLQNELGEITAQRNSNVRSLSEEKQHFYAEIDKSVHDAIAKSDVSSEYKNRYATYRQSLHNLANVEQSGADMSQKLAEAEKAEYALLQTIIPNADSETKSILLPVYNGLEAKYGTTGGVEIAGVVPETYSRSMSLQEQMVRNIEISTKEIERLEQRKDVAKKSEQRRIADDIAREESQKLDDIQKLAVEKSKFYSELNSSLETILPTLSDSARQEYKLAYDSYDETLRTMKIGLGFYDMSVANKIYSDSEIQEYKLLQQMSQVATGETKTVVDNMIGRMEANNSTLRRYKVVVDYVIVENTVNNSSTNSNVAEKRDSVSLNIPDSNSTILASVDSTVVAPKKKSMSGFSADSYGIFEKPEINMGLYYRIQIVAANVKYRMPYFNGLSLIFTEQIPNTNIIRYMTGEYYRYVSAREDLPKVRGLGFSDAFIVAYYNGKRISIGEARRLEALQNVEENEEIPIVIRHEAPADYVEPESIIASSQTKTETISNAENGASFANNSVSGQSVTEGNSAVYSENVAVNGQIVSSGNVVDSQGGIALDSHEIPSKGVYYAVQIGVYKDRRQPSQMKGVSPIDYETMPNGYIRHTSGRFGNYDQARASQANIRRQGISDAFVIAYIDGRKVSFSEAIEYQKSLESRVIAEANTENTTSKTQGVVSSEENLSNVEYAPLNLNTGTEENNKEGISYYVQIGAFSKSPDPEILSVFSKVAGDKIHVKFPREGLQVYRIGVFNSYEEAQNTLAEARSFGIVDAFIVAFKGEEQISSSEAIRLQNAVRQIEGNSGETINNNVGQKSSQAIQPTSNAEPKPVVPAETLQQASGGVEYFVQLGAFVHTPDTRSMATFRAIATTSGSRLSTVQNGKFTNYRVGAFKKFDDVKAAVENARSMGVTDAFVIAFYNGERIPVVEAKEKE